MLFDRIMAKSNEEITDKDILELDGDDDESMEGDDGCQVSPQKQHHEVISN